MSWAKKFESGKKNSSRGKKFELGKKILSQGKKFESREKNLSRGKKTVVGEKNSSREGNMGGLGSFASRTILLIPTGIIFGKDIRECTEDLEGFGSASQLR